MNDPLPLYLTDSAGRLTPAGRVWLTQLVEEVQRLRAELDALTNP
jgi:hypothetical protein